MRHAITVVLLAVFALALLARKPVKETNPATMPVEYRVSGYFPPGFPLHGKVKLLSAPLAETGQRLPVRIEYTVGDMPVETGMTLEIWKHFLSDAEQLQVENAAAPAYFSVKFSRPELRGATRAFTNWVIRDTPAVFPYRKVAAMTLESGRMAAGDRVVFDLGGAQGVRMQYYEENLFNFRVVLVRGDKVLGYGGDALMRISGGPTRRLRAQAVSLAAVGEKFPLEVVPQDEWGSLAKDREGLKLEMSGDGITSRPLVYDRELMHYVARDVTANREGVLRIRVRTPDGKFEALSNPIWVERDPLRRVYYGDLHQHTYLHDGRGVYDELYLYGRRVGLLDFGALTEHHMPMSVTGPQFYLDKRWPSENWPDIQRSTRLFNGWKGFVSILGYEYSVGTPAGGHHNVFFNADEAKSTMQIDPADPSAPIGKMLRTLRLARVPTLVIPHVGGGPPDWSHPTDPRIERLFEIASVHGVFEESWQHHLRNGIRMAASASGDTHTTMMGNANPGLNFVMTNGLTAAYAEGKTRQQIWDAMYQRRTFAVTGNTRVLMDFSVNGEPVGGELSSAHAKTAEVQARVSGTTPVTRIELLKNSQVIHAVTPARAAGSTMLRVVWGDNIYQRRATQGLRSGELRAAAGRLRLLQPLNLDQGFESVEQSSDAIGFTTAAVSGDRDGFLADIAAVSGDLVFKFTDADSVGTIEVKIPLEQLRRTGHFAWSAPAKWQHPYMERMKLAPAFFLECELVNANAPMDVNFSYKDIGPLKPGDYYYLRMEQLDTNKGWTSPVWVN